MKCNHCGAELTAEETLCQVCGNPVEDVAVTEQTADVCACEETCECVCEETGDCACACEENNEENDEESCTEDAAQEETDMIPALKGWKKGTVIACGALIIAFLVGWILNGVGINLLDRTMYEKSYTVSNATLQKKADDVVATIGDKELTNAELQIYYWMVVEENKYSIDKTKELNRQTIDGENCQHQFLEDALSIWEFYVTTTAMAKEAGYELSADEQTYLDELPQLIQDAAEESGMTIQEVMDDMICPGTTEEAYLKYSETYSIGYEYVDYLFDTVEPSLEDLEKYYEENETRFIANKISKDSGNYSSVRHILIMPQGGRQNADGETVYSEDEWAECLKKAEELLALWKSGAATEDTFAEMANIYSEDGGSNTNGGLYSGITSTSNYVPNFLNWVIDENRQVGDTGIVESEYGYHIMYYVSGEPLWITASRDACASAMVDEMIEDYMEENPISVKYNKIALASTLKNEI